MCIKVKTKLAKWLWKSASFRAIVYNFYYAEYVAPLKQKLAELTQKAAPVTKEVKPKRKYTKKKKNAAAKAL